MVRVTGESNTAYTFRYVPEWNITTISLQDDGFEFSDESFGGGKILGIIDMCVDVEVV